MTNFSGKTLLALLMLLLSGGAFADELLSIETWCELQPMAFEPDADNSLNETAAFQELFEEARLIFSGMIYGYSFTYIPLDKTRNVPELFELRPVAEIKRGDKNLRLISRDVSANRLYARFAYTLENFQAARRESWRTLTIPAALGRGEGKAIAGTGEIKVSREQAIKEALRNFLRPRIYNKPREIRGEAVFVEGPVLSLKAGAYVTTVKVKIDIKKIVSYTVY